MLALRHSPIHPALILIVNGLSAEYQCLFKCMCSATQQIGWCPNYQARCWKVPGCQTVNLSWNRSRYWVYTGVCREAIIAVKAANLVQVQVASAMLLLLLLLLSIAGQMSEALHVLSAPGMVSQAQLLSPSPARTPKTLQQTCEDRPLLDIHLARIPTH